MLAGWSETTRAPWQGGRRKRLKERSRRRRGWLWAEQVTATAWVKGRCGGVEEAHKATSPHKRWQFKWKPGPLVRRAIQASLQTLPEVTALAKQWRGPSVWDVGGRVLSSAPQRGDSSKDAVGEEGVVTPGRASRKGGPVARGPCRALVPCVIVPVQPEMDVGGKTAARIVLRDNARPDNMPWRGCSVV